MYIDANLCFIPIAQLHKDPYPVIPMDRKRFSWKSIPRGKT